MITCTIKNEVAVIAVDDGRANAVGFDFMSQMNEALDVAAKDAKAVVITGREGVFSAGFDLGVMRGGNVEDVTRMVGDGGHMLLRLFEFPVPVITACTGHAIAAGALMLLASDGCVAATGDFKIGLNETANGMTLPVFGIELAKAKLQPAHLTNAVVHAALYSGETALAAGYCSELAAPENVLSKAFERAELLSSLPSHTYLANKKLLFGSHMNTIRESLKDFSF